MERLISLLGLIFFTGLAILLSKNKKAISPRIILSGIGIQFVIALLIFRSPLASSFFSWTNKASEYLLQYSTRGATFVFGPMANVDILSKTFGPENAFIFAVSVCATLVFIAGLVAFLYHIRLMPIIISGIGKVMQKLMGTTGAESSVAAANIWYGQTEAPLIIRPYLHKLTKSELLAVMTTGFGTMAVTVFIVYIRFGINPAHLLAASFMGAPAALVMAKILMPETEKSTHQDNNVKLSHEYRGANFMDSICKGASDGIKLFINIVAMLIAVIAIIALFNSILSGLGSLVNIEGLSMERIMGYVFAPLAWLMGIPSKDVLAVGQLIGQKFILNEFIAYMDLARIQQTLEPRSAALATYALCSFANISSTAIQIGGLATLIPERRPEIAKLAFYGMIGGTLSCFMMTCIAGIIL